MDVELFVICDAATDSQGKLNILGTFDTIFTGKLPSVHPQCSIVARVRFSLSEAGEHKLTIDILDDLDVPLIPRHDVSLSVKFSGNEATGIANIIFNIQGMTVTRYGEHKVKLSIDGNPKASLPFFIKQTPKLHG
jgi:hypothetical protein